MDLSKFESLADQTWRFHEPSLMVRSADFQRHVADVRGFGDLLRQYGVDGAAQQQNLVGELLALAPELLREVLRLRQQTALLQATIREATDLANGRESEWGDRAVMCFDVLAAGLQKSLEQAVPSAAGGTDVG